MHAKAVVMSVLAAILLAGCGREEAASPRVWRPTMENPQVRKFAEEAPMYVEDMKDGDVIVAVNGVPFTKRDADIKLKRTRWTLYIDQRLKVERKNDMFRAFGVQMIPQFVNTQLMVWEARRLGLLKEDEIVRKVTAKVRQSSRVYGRTPEDLDREIPGGLYELKRTFEDMVWCEAFSRTVKPETIVDDAYVSNLVAGVEAENKSIAETNAAVLAKLEGVLRDVKSGKMSFEDAAEKYTDEALSQADGGVWGVFQPSFIEPDALRTAVAALKKGEISGILEDEECYMVVKMIDRRDSPEEGNITDNQDEPVFTLGRIAMEKTSPVELAYGTDMKEELQAQFMKEAMEKRVEQLAANADIVYPHGTNFWKKTERKARKPSKKGAGKKKKLDKKEGRDGKDNG